MNNIWKDICSVIYESKYRNIFKSLKIPIYGFTAKKWNVRIVYIIKYFVIVFISFTKHKISKSIYDIVFFLPYSTPSNIDNLLPVVNYSVTTGQSSLLILGEDFNDNKHLKVLPSCKHLYINELYGNISIYIKISNLLIALYYYVKIFQAYNKYPTIKISIRRNIVSSYYYIYSTLLYRAIFTHVFSEISSKSALSTSDFWPAENQFIMCAMDHGYNTYLIQHGIIAEFWWPFDAEYYFVWGELHKDQLVSLGAPEDKIIAVGMPALDKNVEKIIDYKIILSKPMKLLIISQTHAPIISESFSEKYASCLNVLKGMAENCSVTVKLHPNEGMQFYDKYGFRNSKNFFFVKSERSIQDLILNSDICITLFSSGGLEAIALNRLLVVLNLESWIEDYAWWPKYGGGLYVSNDITLRDYIIKISKDKGFILELIEKQTYFLNKSFCNMGNVSNKIIKNIATI